MPTIAIVEGVRITIYLDGTMPRPKLKVVRAWLDANREQVSYIRRETRAGRCSGGMIA